MTEDLRRLMRALARADLPPPASVYTHPRVPYGVALRQWDTRGRLILWANPAYVATLPQGGPYPPVDVRTGTISALWGVPVIDTRPA